MSIVVRHQREKERERVSDNNWKNVENERESLFMPNMGFSAKIYRVAGKYMKYSEIKVLKIQNFATLFFFLRKFEHCNIVHWSTRKFYKICPFLSAENFSDFRSDLFLKFINLNNF